MAIGNYTDVVMYRGSRIREYQQEEAKRRVADARVKELETQVEDEERRNLRLTRELNEEVALRARAERKLKEESKKVEDLREELETAQANELPQPIKKPAKPRKAATKKRAKPVAPAPQPVPQSSRKRGSVK